MEERIAAVQAAAEQLLRERERIIIAIDGRCGSGKSTLAAALSERFGWPVVHMDDFYLRPMQRTAERLSSPGENVDHERFLEEVLRPLCDGEPVSYRPFSCRTMTLCQPVTLPGAAVTVVEGSYACHPSLRDRYDLRVFLDIDPVTQMERIVRRNGPEKAEELRTRWIPLEEKYFAALDVASCCELKL